MSQDAVAKPWPLRPGCTVDLARQEVRIADRAVGLTAREAELLGYLIAREAQDVSIEALHLELWGHGPEVISRAAQNTAHRLKRKIERDPKHPEHLLTVHGVGFRLVRSKEVEAVPVASDEDPLFGRQNELTQARRLLGEHPVVTISGLGGMGKTRLARAILREEGGVWVDLTSARDDEELMRAVAGALGLVRGPDPMNQIGAGIASRGRTLVVLDNVEQLVDSLADALPRWRERAPEARWLLTSRVRLGAEGEQLIDLGALATPDLQATEDDIRTAPAVQLFLARAAGDPGSLTSVAALCRELEGIPLALELAAARTVMMDATGIRDRLTERLRLLSRPGAGRHDAVSATLEWSWSLLSESQRAALAQCTVFRTPFRVDAAEQTLRLPGDDFVLDTLQALVDASLLTRVAGSSPARLRMYEVTRDFAAQLVADDGLPMRHARVFARHGSPQRDLSDRALGAEDDLLLRDAELEDMIAGIEAALTARDISVSLDLARAIAASMKVRGPLLGARPWVEAALALSSDQEDYGDRRATLGLAWAASLAEASRWDELQAVQAIALRDGPTSDERVQWHWLNTLRHLFQADPEAAQRSWVAAMDGVGDNGPLRAQILILGGHLALRRRELDEARAMFSRALELAAGRPGIERLIHAALGTALAALGQHEDALNHNRRSLELAIGGRQIHARADSHEGLGVLLAQLGRLDEAEHHYAEAASAYAKLGMRRSTLLANWAELAIDRGDPATGRLRATEAVGLARSAGATLIEGLIRVIEGRAYLELGDPLEALASLDVADSLLPESESGARVELERLRGLAMARARLLGAADIASEIDAESG